MTNFESPVKTIQASSEKIFTFLGNFNNFGNLVPAEISNWKSSENECSFTIQSMISLSMEIQLREPFHLIVMKSKGSNIFDFFIRIFISSIGENESTARVVFEADLNPMMAMLASKPLENFVKLVVEKLKEEMEK